MLAVATSELAGGAVADSSIAATHSWNVGVGGSGIAFADLRRRKNDPNVPAPPTSRRATARSIAVKRAGNIVFISDLADGLKPAAGSLSANAAPPSLTSTQRAALHVRESATSLQSRLCGGPR